MFKKTKSALALGILAIVLCMGMLVGTTYAWFTDSVSSANNIIQAGNLDVKLEYKTNWSNEWAPVDENTKLFKEGALYEPGYTEIVYLRVSNAGSLALKYMLSFNISNEESSVNVYGEEFKLSDYLQIGTYVQDEYNSGFNYANILMPSMFGTRESALQNVTLHTLSSADTKIRDNAPILPGENTAQVVAIVLTLPETVGNEANHNGVNAPSIDLGINLVATQYTHENDSFGNDYDADVEIPTVVANVNELKEAVTKGGKYILGANLTIDADTDKITVPSGVKVELDLNGKTIKATANNTGNQELFLVKGNMTVVNGTLEFTAENNQGWGAMATIFDVTAGGVLNLENVKASVSGTDMNFIVHLNNWGSATLNVNKCDFTATYVAIRAFNSGYDMNNVTIKNSDFHTGRMFWVHNYTSEGKDDKTLNLDIYGNNNTSDHAKPVRFGFDNEVYYDINGNKIA